MNEVHFIRFENQMNFRYYLLHLSQDLFGHWTLIKSWGGINKAGGRLVSITCPSYEEALTKIHLIKKQRERRGYQIVEKPFLSKG